MEISTLKLEWKRREGTSNIIQRDFLDFVIDGESLYEKLGRGNISPLGWFTPQENLRIVNQLLLKQESELPGNRYPLYVCAECGDLGCGAITAVIESEENKIIWKDFGYQNNYEEEIHPVRFSGMFAFDESQYRTALEAAL